MYFVYVIPIIACLLLRFSFDYSGEWTAYLWIILFGEAIAGLLHWGCFRIHTSSEEYLGSIVDSIHYEEPWTELIERTETKTDSSGKSYTVKRIDEKFHPEQYYFYTTLDTRIKCSRGFFNSIRETWDVPGHTDTWRDRKIKGGVRYGTTHKFRDLGPRAAEDMRNWVPVTESHYYTNKIRCSNSIFKFEKIDKKQAAELGLFDYPKIKDYDADCILSRSFTVTDHEQGLFRRFNARIAPRSQMRLYILLFEAGQGIGIAEMQRAYWQGGNKNEFVVCLGLNYDETVEWAKVFSWADLQDKEVEAAQWFVQHPNLDWNEAYNYLSNHIYEWKRKEFADFDYIHVTLPLWQVLSAFALSIIENIIALSIALK